MDKERDVSLDHIDIAGKVRIARRSLICLLEQFENFDVSFNFQLCEYILRKLLSDLDHLGRKMLEKPKLSLPPYLPEELEEELDGLCEDLGLMESIMVLRCCSIFIDGHRVSLGGFSEKAGLAIRWLFQTGPHKLSKQACWYMKDKRPDVKNVKIVVGSLDAPERGRMHQHLAMEFGGEKKISRQKSSYSHIGIFPRKSELIPRRMGSVPSMFREYKGESVWATGPEVPERQCVCL